VQGEKERVIEGEGERGGRKKGRRGQ